MLDATKGAPIHGSQLTEVSKYLSFLLRHQPEAIGLTLDEQGWALIDELINKTTEHTLTPEVLAVVVETSDKQRFAISDDGLRIRANQGHSIRIDLGLLPIEPPATLFHGTADKSWPMIAAQGLVKGQRHHVHLTESLPVARSVGARYGNPVLLSIDSAAMHRDGFEFFRSANNVWLVDSVPANYIKTV